MRPKNNKRVDLKTKDKGKNNKKGNKKTITNQQKKGGKNDNRML